MLLKFKCPLRIHQHWAYPLLFTELSSTNVLRSVNIDWLSLRVRMFYEYWERQFRAESIDFENVGLFFAFSNAKLFFYISLGAFQLVVVVAV